MRGNIEGREGRESREGWELPDHSERGLETEHPAKCEILVAGTLVLGQLRPTHIEGEIKSGHELGVADAVRCPKAHSGIAEKANRAGHRCLAHASNPVRELGEEREAHPIEEMRLGA